MSRLANHDILWHGPTTIVLGAFCLAAVIMVLATVVHDLIWRRNERKRDAAGRDGQTAPERDQPRSTDPRRAPIRTR